MRVELTINSRFNWLEYTKRYNSPIPHFTNYAKIRGFMRPFLLLQTEKPSSELTNDGFNKLLKSASRVLAPQRLTR
jgi:hypothetical protein